MSRSSEELKREHDLHYDAEIYNGKTDFETWMHDFGSDAIFNVTFREQGEWSHECYEYKLWTSIEFENGEILIGWRPVEWDGLHNSVKFHRLCDCEITYYPVKEDSHE